MDEHGMRILAAQRSDELRDEARRARLAKSAAPSRPPHDAAKPRSSLRISLDHILRRVPV